MPKKLSERAMLVSLSHSFWTGRAKDSKISKEVAERKGAERNSGAWWTYLIPRKEMKNVYNAINKCRAIHQKLTLPWNDNGCRILPTTMFIKYSKEMRECKSEFNEAVDEFLKNYPEILTRAHKRLGKLLDNKELPTMAEVKRKFGISQEIYPLPDVDDFRVNLTKEDISEIRKQMHKSIDSTIERAMTSIWERLIELVEKIEETLGEPKKVFRDTLISNLKDFCELIPKLNLTNDSKLESIREEVVTKLTNLRPDNLREIKTERVASAKMAKEVLKKMKDYVNV